MLFNKYNLGSGSTDKKIKALNTEIFVIDRVLSKNLADANANSCKAIALMKLFQLTEDQKHIQNALVCFTRAIDSEPNTPIYYVERANCYINLKQEDLARADLDKASSFPKSDDILEAYNLTNKLETVEAYFSNKTQPSP